MNLGFLENQFIVMEIIIVLLLFDHFIVELSFVGLICFKDRNCFNVC